MYSNIKYLGIPLDEWRKCLNNAFSLGELYQMVKDGVRLEKFTR